MESFVAKTQQHPQPTKLLGKMIGMSAKQIAAVLGVPYQQFREMQLSPRARRRPRSVDVKVSRGVIEEWGLDPREFFQNRRLASIVGYEVAPVWFAIWKSTNGEFRALERQHHSALEDKIPKWTSPEISWANLIAARCNLASTRYLWLEEQVMDVAWDHVFRSYERGPKSKQRQRRARGSKLLGYRLGEAPNVGPDFNAFDPEKFSVNDRNLGSIASEESIYNRWPVIELMKLLKTECPARQPTPTELFKNRRRFGLGMITLFCWEIKISPR